VNEKKKPQRPTRETRSQTGDPRRALVLVLVRRELVAWLVTDKTASGAKSGKPAAFALGTDSMNGSGIGGRVNECEALFPPAKTQIPGSLSVRATLASR
jgi:hypothetical protein